MKEQPILLITHTPEQPDPMSAFDPDLDNDFCQGIEEYEEPTVNDLKNAKGQDKIDLLHALMQKMSKSDLAIVAAAFTSSGPKTRKGTPHAGPVQQFKVITVHGFCRNCDHTIVYTTELKEGQHKSYVRKNGTVGYVECKKNFDPMTIQAWSNSCELCHTRIMKWTREKLEERYMQLLCRLTFDETPSTTNDW
jgi:hypothetical protein